MDFMLSRATRVTAQWASAPVQHAVARFWRDMEMTLSTTGFVPDNRLMICLAPALPPESYTLDVTDEKKGLGSYEAEITPDALEFLADIAGGDARAALNAIELGILTTERSSDGKIHIDLDTASECIQKRVVRLMTSR